MSTRREPASKSNRIVPLRSTAAVLLALLLVGVWLLRSDLARPSLSSHARTAPSEARRAALRSTSNGEMTAFVDELRERIDRGASLDGIAQVVSAFARRHPAAALDAVRELGLSPRDTRTLVSPVVARWAAVDPTASWRWTVAAGTTCDVPGEPPLSAAVLTQIAAVKPDLVGPLFAELLETDSVPAGLNLAAVADAAIAALLPHDSAEAWAALAKWAATAHADRLSGEPFQRVALAQAERDPAQAARQLEALPNGPGRSFALAAVADAWAKSDPHAALGWAQQISSDDSRSMVRRAAFARWEQSDMTGAAEWLAVQPSGPEVDPLVAEVIADARSVRANVQAVLSLAGTISEPRLRHQAIESIVRRWSESDPQAATHYVATNSTLPLAEKHQLLDSICPNDDDPEN